MNKEDDLMNKEDDLMNKEDFVKDILYNVGGMVNEKECLWLYNMASRCSKGVIVEIGSWTGLSTICLAAGSKAGSNVKVYSIDPFIGSPYVPDPGSKQAIDSNNEGMPDNKYYIDQGKTFDTFWKNVKRYGMENIVYPIKDYSELAVKRYPGDPIGLLFIDGDHRFNYVKKDFELWSPFLISKGMIVMHDIPFPGVDKVINMYIKVENGNFVDISEEGIFHATKR